MQKNRYLKHRQDVASFCHTTICFLVVQLIVFFLIGNSASITFAENLRCFQTTWPSESSDLLPDDQIVRGTFKNSFRYVIKKNKEPRGRIALYLYIGAGSLHEKEHERGYAHFLEHLMFNGSENFPPGRLIDELQSIGMDFGRDTNAFTSFDKTVYRLMLPTNKEKHLDLGMQVIADYSRGALLLDSEIDKERGVIFSEKKERDSASYRTHVAKSKALYKGTRYPERMVIGIDQTLASADHDKIKGFYDAWYRPENMVLVVVGDIETGLVVKTTKKYFNGLENPKPLPGCPEFGELAYTEAEAFYHFEPEEGHTTVSIESYWDKSLENDSVALQETDLKRIMSNLVIGYKLQKLQEENDLPYVNADYHAGAILGRIGYASMVAQSPKENWEKSLKVLTAILKDIEENGVSEHDVDRAKKEILAELKHNVITEESLDSRSVARRIIRHLAENRVYMNAIQEQQLYSGFLETITKEDIHRVIQNDWASSRRVISVTGNVEIDGDQKEQISLAYEKAEEQDAVRLSVSEEIDFPYLEPNKPVEGKTETTEFKKIGVNRYILPNGLVVNLKPTEFEKDSLRFAMTFGNGELEEQASGQAFIVQDIINLSGSNELTPSSIDSILAGSSISLSFGIGASSFNWTGSSLTEEFDLVLQLLHTFIYDIGFREKAYQNVMQSVGLMYDRLEYDINGAVPLKIQPFLADNNIHFGLPPYEETTKFTYDYLEKWVREKIVVGDLELSVVGDFDNGQILGLIQSNLGGVQLKKWEEAKQGPIKFPIGKKLITQVDSSIEKSLVAIAWPARDFWNISETRRLNLLASIFEDRLRKTVREELGASYSPEVSNFGSRVYPNYGYIIAELTVQTGFEDKVVDTVLSIGNDLNRNGVSEEELNRIKKPLVTSVKDNIKKNQYWLYSVLMGSTRHPAQLRWPLTIVDDIKSITETELSLLAGNYLINKNAAVVKVTPNFKE